MTVLPAVPAAKGPAEWFTADVWFERSPRHVTDAEYAAGSPGR